MQIRSGAYRVPPEPRSSPAERDAGRNRAILSSGDSFARLEPVKFSRRHFDRRRCVIVRGAFLSGIYYHVVFDAVDCAPRVSSTPSTPELHVPEIIGYATPARVNEALFCFSPSFPLSPKDYLNLSRVVEDSRLSPSGIILRTSALFRSSTRYVILISD